MKRYVVGFLFDTGCGQVALLEKNRPAWQAGKLNGIGGHIEDGETAREAMVREFREEAGIEIKSWELFLVMYCPDAEIYFYRAFVDCDVFNGLKTMTDERVYDVHITHLTKFACVPNLYWLLPLAFYQDGDYDYPIIVNSVDRS